MTVEQDEGFWARKVLTAQAERDRAALPDVEQIRTSLRKAGKSEDLIEALVAQEVLYQALAGLQQAGQDNQTAVAVARAYLDVELARQAARVANRNARSAEKYAQGTARATAALVAVTFLLVIVTAVLVWATLHGAG